MKSLYSFCYTDKVTMEAQQIDDKFKGEFPDSHRITNGDVLEVRNIEKFVSQEKKLDGVKLTLKDGTFAHTTAKQPVGYILSPKLDLPALIAKATDGAVTLFFGETLAQGSNRPMLRCSIYKNAV